MEVIGLASDHAGFEMKEFIKQYLVSMDYKVQDFGTYSFDSCDYTDFAHSMANAIEVECLSLGFAFCGSGNGINISLNRHQKVRSAYCWLPEIAKLARAHNDANVCVIPARFIDQERCLKIVAKFLKHEFEGGRHQQRIDKIEIKE